MCRPSDSVLADATQCHSSHISLVCNVTYQQFMVMMIVLYYLLIYILLTDWNLFFDTIATGYEEQSFRVVDFFLSCRGKFTHSPMALSKMTNATSRLVHESRIPKHLCAGRRAFQIYFAVQNSACVGNKTIDQYNRSIE